MKHINSMRVLFGLTGLLAAIWLFAAQSPPAQTQGVPSSPYYIGYQCPSDNEGDGIAYRQIDSLHWFDERFYEVVIDYYLEAGGKHHYNVWIGPDGTLVDSNGQPQKDSNGELILDVCEASSSYVGSYTALWDKAKAAYRDVELTFVPPVGVIDPTEKEVIRSAVRVSPSSGNVNLDVGIQQTFIAQGDDSSGKMNHVEWWVNGAPAAVFNFSATASFRSMLDRSFFSPGANKVQVIFSNMDAATPSANTFWTVTGNEATSTPSLPELTTPPSVKRISPISAEIDRAVGASLIFTVGADDPEGDIKSLKWTVNDALEWGIDFKETFSRIDSFHRSFSSAGTYIVQAVYSNSDEAVDFASWKIIVTNQEIPAKIISPVPGSSISVDTATFSWSGGAGVFQSYIDIGHEPGESNVYAGLAGADLSATVINLPMDGSAVFVRLWYQFGSGWQFDDYKYQLNSPSSETPSPSLESRVARFIGALGPPPPYLLEQDNLAVDAFSLIGGFLDWAFQGNWTDTYDELYNSGLRLDALSRNAGARAEQALIDGESKNAEIQLEQALRLGIMSRNTFSSASRVFGNQLESGMLASEEIKDRAQDLWILVWKIQNPKIGEAFEYLFLATDYAIDYKVWGGDEANRRFWISLITTTLVNQLPFDALGGLTLEQYSKLVTSYNLDTVLEQILRDEGAVRVTELILSELLNQGITDELEFFGRQLLDDILEYKNRP